MEEENDNIEEENDEDKKPIGRPKGIPATLSQKLAVSKAAKEYQRKVKEGLIEKEIWETHGAYSFIKTGRINKRKQHLVKYVYEEREKWIEELGGTENLSNIEVSMLDEASRLLLFSVMINEHILTNKEDSILYKDEETGEIKMHSALSRNYLSFTKTYISILKELQKLVVNKTSKSSRNNKKDMASAMQSLYHKK